LTNLLGYARIHIGLNLAFSQVVQKYLRGKQQGMFSFIHLFEPLSALGRKPWLSGHNSSPPEVSLLRWMARAIFCVGRSSRVGWVVLADWLTVRLPVTGSREASNKVLRPSQFCSER